MRDQHGIIGPATRTERPGTREARRDSAIKASTSGLSTQWSRAVTKKRLNRIIRKKDLPSFWLHRTAIEAPVERGEARLYPLTPRAREGCVRG